MIELWYLVVSGGQSAEKKFVGPKMGQIRAKKGQNEVLGHFHVQNALVFANFAYYDRELWYLVVSGGRSAEKIFGWP